MYRLPLLRDSNRKKWLNRVSTFSGPHQIHPTDNIGLKTIPPFQCDFRDPWGNRIQVVDIHDESTAWLQPYEEVQEVGAKLPD